MLQNVVSHQGLHCLPFIQQLLETATESEMELFKSLNKYGNECRDHNTVKWFILQELEF